MASGGIRFPDLRDDSAKKCSKCGVRNVAGSPDLNVCSYQAALQNIGFFFLADGNGFNKGNVKWQCCNCARDIRFGKTTLTDAQYEKTACFQCRNRPKEMIARMRTENYVAPIPRHLDPQYQVSNRGVAITVVCGLILIAIAVGSYVMSVQGFFYGGGGYDTGSDGSGKMPGNNITM